MIKINNISIDLSLLKKIDLECINSKCVHNSCCHTDDRKLTAEDIEKIKSANVTDRVFYDFMDTLRWTSTSESRWPTCVFLKNERCILEQHNAVPSQCKSFPIILNEGVLKLSNADIPCLEKGSTPAYILLKREIVELLGKDFYEKLVTLLSKPEDELFYMCRK